MQIQEAKTMVEEDLQRRLEEFEDEREQLQKAADAAASLEQQLEQASVHHHWLGGHLQNNLPVQAWPERLRAIHKWLWGLLVSGPIAMGMCGVVCGFCSKSHLYQVWDLCKSA